MKNKEKSRKLSFARDILDQIEVFVAENAQFGYTSTVQFVEEAVRLHLAALGRTSKYAIVDLSGDILEGKLMNKTSGQKIAWRHWRKQVSAEMLSQLLRDGHAVFRNLALNSDDRHIDVEVDVVKFKGAKALKVRLLDVKPRVVIQ